MASTQVALAGHAKTPRPIEAGCRFARGSGRGRRLPGIVMGILIGGALPACSWHRPALPGKPVGTRPAKNMYRALPEETLSNYIRVVLKTSQEHSGVPGEALECLHQREPELAALARHLSEHPDDILSRRGLAAAYLKAGLYSDALPLYQQIQTLVPDDPSVELAMARIWHRWGDDAMALPHARQAVTLDPNGFEGHELLARIYLHRNEPDSAVPALFRALELAPADPALLTNIGYAYMLKRDWVTARAYLEQALRQDGSLPRVHNNLGIALANLGDSDGALREFKMANPPAVAFNNLGVVYLDQKNWDAAYHAFHQALALDPEYEKARLNLVEMESYRPIATVVQLAPIGPGDQAVVGPLSAEAMKGSEPAKLQVEERRISGRNATPGAMEDPTAIPWPGPPRALSETASRSDLDLVNKMTMTPARPNSVPSHAHKITERAYVETEPFPTVRAIPDQRLGSYSSRQGELSGKRPNIWSPLHRLVLGPFNRLFKRSTGRARA